MPRERRHPSGPAEVVTVRLSPAAIAVLDSWRAARSLSRGAAVERMVLRAMGPRPGAAGLPLPASSVPAVQATAQGRHPATHRVVSATEAETPDEAAFAEGVPAVLTGVVPPSGVCGHERYTVVAGGMRRCNQCGAIRGIGGVWRLP